MNILHEKTFLFIEELRKELPDLLYHVRQKNTHDRLDHRLWFQGREDYAFVGLYIASGHHNHTRSVGIVFGLESGELTATINVVFPGENDRALLKFYDHITNDEIEFQKIRDTKYVYRLNTGNLKSEVHNFLVNIKPKWDRKAMNLGLERIIITREYFLKHFAKIERRRESYKLSQNTIDPNETEREGLVNCRVGQGAYRVALLKKWGYRCAVTGCNVTQILIASHIKAWKDSSDFERHDVDNEILLSPNLDALFDRHLISFRSSGQILISSRIEQNEFNSLGINTNMKIKVDDGIKKYVVEHRRLYREKELVMHHEKSD